ncbi:MAG: hypothetical protein ACXV74_13225 [Methylobacter sp.]
MNTKVFLVFVTLLLALGIYFGYVLSNRPTFSIPGILNLIGIVYSITAVIVLYETIAQNTELKKMAIGFFAPVILWAQTVVPLGVALSWFFTRDSSHGSAVASFGFSFFSYSLLPLGFLDAAVVFPRIDTLMPIDGRHRRLGLFLLSGLVMQFLAALKSL